MMTEPMKKKRRATPTQIIKFVIGCIIDAVTKNRSLEDETALYLPTFVPRTFLLIAVLFFFLTFVECAVQDGGGDGIILFSC